MGLEQGLQQSATEPVLPKPGAASGPGTASQLSGPKQSSRIGSVEVASLKDARDQLSLLRSSPESIAVQRASVALYNLEQAAPFSGGAGIEQAQQALARAEHNFQGAVQECSPVVREYLDLKKDLRRLGNQLAARSAAGSEHLPELTAAAEKKAAALFAHASPECQRLLLAEHSLASGAALEAMIKRCGGTVPEPQTLKDKVRSVMASEEGQALAALREESGGAEVLYASAAFKALIARQEPAVQEFFARSQAANEMRAAGHAALAEWRRTAVAGMFDGVEPAGRSYAGPRPGTGTEIMRGSADKEVTALLAEEAHHQVTSAAAVRAMSRSSGS